MYSKYFKNITRNIKIIVCIGIALLNINKLWLQVTDYSLIILIQASRISGTQSYQGVMNAAFGTVGYTVLSILQFIYPFIGIHGSDIC